MLLLVEVINEELPVAVEDVPEDVVDGVLEVRDSVEVTTIVDGDPV